MRTNSLKLFFLIVMSLLLSACATATITENDRAKALVLLSENSPGIMLVAGMPLNYYCHHKAWPKPSALDTSQRYLTDFNNLNYTINQNQYAAQFDLRSFVPNDTFVSHWTMNINKPNPDIRGKQKVAIQILEPDLHVNLKSRILIDCWIGQNGLIKISKNQYGVMPNDPSQAPQALYQ